MYFGFAVVARCEIKIMNVTGLRLSAVHHLYTYVLCCYGMLNRPCPDEKRILSILILSAHNLSTVYNDPGNPLI